jgi:hypothetical protein
MNALKLLKPRGPTRAFLLYSITYVLPQLRHVLSGSEGVNDLIVLRRRSKEVFKSQLDLVQRLAVGACKLLRGYRIGD